MTKEKNEPLKKGADRMLPVLVCVLFVLFSAHSARCASALHEGLRLCARSVIPSLFPFMVLSGLLVRFGGTRTMSHLFSGVCGFLFGIGGEGAAVPVLGAVCGFPTGAYTAYCLYEEGRIDKNELERLLAFSNNPSPAFLISAVGLSLFSSARFGAVLYAAELFPAFCIGMVLSVIYRPNGCKKTNIVQKHEHERERAHARKKRVSSVFTETVASSASAMLNVCAFVLFFSALSGVLSGIFEKYGVGQTAKTVIGGFFEMTGAASEASKVIPREKGMILAALVCGFSGFSVHFQVMSLCPYDDISFRPYFLAKIFQGLLSALFLLVYIKIAGVPTAETSLAVFAPFYEKSTHVFSIFCDAFFIVGVFIFGLKNRGKRGRIKQIK